MFIEYQIYDPEAHEATVGLGEFKGIRYDAEFKLVSLVLEDNFIIVCKIEELMYNSMLYNIKQALATSTSVYTIPYTWLMDDDDVDYIEKSLQEAEHVDNLEDEDYDEESEDYEDDSEDYEDEEAYTDCY